MYIPIAYVPNPQAVTLLEKEIGIPLSILGGAIAV
jgi:hypothetical protein